jgi:hypothetical protein
VQYDRTLRPAPRSPEPFASYRNGERLSLQSGLSIILAVAAAFWAAIYWALSTLV